MPAQHNSAGTSQLIHSMEDLIPAVFGQHLNQYIQPDRFAVIVVGDLAKIEKGIRAANLGPVKVVTIDEVLK